MKLRDSSNNQNVILHTEEKWFLQTKVPTVISYLDRLINLGIDFILNSQRKSNNKEENKSILLDEDEEDELDIKIKDSRIISFQSLEKTLKGFVIIEGCEITEAEIEIKFPKWQRGQVLKTIISRTQPLHFSQLQSVLSQLQEAKELIQLVDTTKATSHELEQGILSSLIKAQTELLTPPKTVFPIPPSTKMLFHPSLPPELLLDFKIKGTSLLITSAILQSTSKPQDSKRNPKIFFSRRQNQYYTIVEQASVECTTEKLETISNILSLTISQCNELLLKLNQSRYQFET